MAVLGINKTQSESVQLGKTLGPKKILVSKKVWVKKNVGSEKNLGFKKNVGENLSKFVDFQHNARTNLYLSCSHYSSHP